MVDEMAKCEHRDGNRTQIRAIGRGFGWARRHTVWEKLGNLVRRYFPYGQWRTALLCRCRRETKKLCKKDCSWCGYARRWRLYCRTTKFPSKRKAVYMERPATRSKSPTYASADFYTDKAGEQ